MLFMKQVGDMAHVEMNDGASPIEFGVSATQLAALVVAMFEAFDKPYMQEVYDNIQTRTRTQ